MRDLRRELEEAPGGGYSELPMWQPEPGDIITGRLVGYVTRTTKRGPARIAVIDTEENEPRGVCGERTGVWVTSTVLKGHFEKEMPRPGDRLGIKYAGRHPEKQYHLFSLVCERDETLPPASASMRQASRPYAAATMRGQPRAASPGVVSRGPADEDFNDPFADGNN